MALHRNAAWHLQIGPPRVAEGERVSDVVDRQFRTVGRCTRLLFLSSANLDSQCLKLKLKPHLFSSGFHSPIAEEETTGSYWNALGSMGTATTDGKEG